MNTATTWSAQCIHCAAWSREPERAPSTFRPIHGNLLTGEPYAGEPPARFGGRGAQTNELSLPLSMLWQASVDILWKAYIRITKILAAHEGATMRSLFLTGFLMTSASLFASTGPIEPQNREVVVDNV
jgi:hypothetical protein